LSRATPRFRRHAAAAIFRLPLLLRFSPLMSVTLPPPPLRHFCRCFADAATPFAASFATITLCHHLFSPRCSAAIFAAITPCLIIFAAMPMLYDAVTPYLSCLPLYYFRLPPCHAHRFRHIFRHCLRFRHAAFAADAAMFYAAADTPLLPCRAQCHFACPCFAAPLPRYAILATIAAELRQRCRHAESRRCSMLTPARERRHAAWFFAARALLLYAHAAMARHYALFARRDMPHLRQRLPLRAAMLLPRLTPPLAFRCRCRAVIFACYCLLVCFDAIFSLSPLPLLLPLAAFAAPCRCRAPLPFLPRLSPTFSLSPC
jgi:hypothetical protein